MEKKIRFFSVFLFLSHTYLITARPLIDDGQVSIDGPIDISKSTLFDDVEAIYERLKLGDADAWQRYGSEVVDVVYHMVDEGVADDPFDALLMLFYPNLTPKERKDTLRKFEPFLRKLAEQPIIDAGDTGEDLTLYKRDASADRLQQALKQLKIRPSESLVNLENEFDNRKRPPEKRTKGQKEMPIYLGTHESPEGITWRG